MTHKGFGSGKITMNVEEIKIWKGMVAMYLKVIFWYSPEDNKNHKKPQ
jgi:hypothetical protein